MLIISTPYMFETTFEGSKITAAIENIFYDLILLMR